MRSTTAGERTTLGLLNRTVTWRVKIANGSGTMTDLSSWLEKGLRNEDVDQPVAGAVLEFTRASGVLQTLSPLRTDSTLNRLDDGVTYAPRIDLVRDITIEVATTPTGILPGPADYKLKFKGSTSTIDFSGSPIIVDCRDQGGLLVDRWIEAPKLYGSGPGVALETVMQAIHDDNLGAGVVPVWTPASPSYLISPAYQQQVQSIMDADLALAQLPGWDVRYRWDDGTGTFRFKLSQPDRTKTVPDYTFGPKDYFNFTTLELSETDIRNVIIVDFKDSADLGNRKKITVTDATSITKYRRRPLIITEGDTSPINTVAEATALANAALADLKDPKAEAEIVMPFFWPAELGDLYRFSANGVHFDTDQDWAVVSVTDELSKGQHETRIKVRGKPAGQYMTWLARGGTIGGPTGGGPAQPPVPYIDFRNGETNELVWKLRFNVINGSGGGGANISYVITSKRASGSEATIDSGTGVSLPRNLDITRDPKVGKVIRFIVTDAATGLSAEDKITVPSIRDEIDDSGFPKRGKPFDDGDYTPRGTGTGDLRSGVGQENGGSVKAVASGRDDSPPLVHGQSRSYPTNFQNPAKIDIFGGLSYEPASVWGSSDPGTNTAFGSSAPAATAQVDESYPISVSVSGYTTRARLRQAGSSTARSNSFAAGSITTNGGDKQVTVASAPAFDDTYYADFTYDFQATGAHAGLDPSSVSATVSLQYYNGSSWVTLATFTDGDSDPGTSGGGSGSCGISGSSSLSGVQSGLIGSSLMRILLTTNSGVGIRTYSVDPGNLTYTTSTGEQYARKTPTGVTVAGSALGAS